MAVFNSMYRPKVTMSEKMLKKQVTEIYYTPYGLAVCVEDVPEPPKEE